MMTRLTIALLALTGSVACACRPSLAREAAPGLKEAARKVAAARFDNEPGATVKQGEGDDAPKVALTGAKLPKGLTQEECEEGVVVARVESDVEPEQAGGLPKGTHHMLVAHVAGRWRLFLVSDKRVIDAGEVAVQPPAEGVDRAAGETSVNLGGGGEAEGGAERKWTEFKFKVLRSGLSVEGTMRHEASAVDDSGFD